MYSVYKCIFSSIKTWAGCFQWCLFSLSNWNMWHICRNDDSTVPDSYADRLTEGRSKDYLQHGWEFCFSQNLQPNSEYFYPLPRRLRAVMLKLYEWVKIAVEGRRQIFHFFVSAIFWIGWSWTKDMSKCLQEKGTSVTFGWSANSLLQQTKLSNVFAKLSWMAAFKFEN